MDQSSDYGLELLPLWIDGQVHSSVVRPVLEAFAAGWAEVAARVRAEVDSSSDRDALARRVAAMRDKEAHPRVVRMSLDERVVAIDALLAALLGLEFDEDGRIALERLLGLRSGHGGGLAGAAGVRVDMDWGSILADGHAMPLAVAAASDDQLELARLILAWFRDWMAPLLAPLLAEYGAKSAAFERIAESVLTEPPAALYAAVAVSLLATQARREVPDDQVREAIAGLSAGASDLQLLLRLPETERRAVFAQLPEIRREAIATALRTQTITPDDE